MRQGQGSADNSRLACVVAEARMLQIYGKRASVGPHTYTDGHYVTVKPASGDTTNLIIFETNNGRVTSYRAGRLPQVRYVEGCA